MSEIWKRAVYHGKYYDLYEVSNLGNVRSLSRLDCAGRWRKGRILKSSRCDKSRHHVVTFSVDGRCTSCRVHRLVLETFVGRSGDGHEACHNNGNGEDNRLLNLRWDTPSNNTLDKIKHGTMPMGSRHWKSKLTEVQVKQIRQAYIKGSANANLTILARRYGVHLSMIHLIVKNKSWKHLQRGVIA